MLGDLGQRDLDVLALLFKLAPVLAQHGHEGGELLRGVGRRVVHVHQLLDFRQAQAQPLAAQRELQARAVALGVDAVAAGAPGREQAHVLVEADGAGGDVELGRQLGDGEGARDWAWDGARSGKNL